MTRHISPEARISQSITTSRISPKTGKVRKRAKRPRLCLTDRLANLRLLLEAKSFQRWPLKLTFFAEDVHRMWQKLIQKYPGPSTLDIDVALHEPVDELVSAAREDYSSMPLSTIGINAIDVGYSSLKSQIEKGQNHFASGKPIPCAICNQNVSATGAGALVCNSASCSATSHLQCLSKVFLRSEGVDQDSLVPKRGQCPGCGHGLRWIDLVKDLSLRMRGEKEIQALYKQKRTKKTLSVSAALEIPESDHEETDSLEMAVDANDEWHDLSDSSDDESHEKKLRRDPDPGHGQSAFLRIGRSVPLPEPIIEDSENSGGWTDAEVMT